MKIGFIGSHGVGKTTLCFDLAARLKRLDLAVDLVKEVARSCPLPINRDTTIEAQAWILHTQVARELVAQQQYAVVICDRSVLDNYAYLVHAAGRRPEYEEFVRSWVGSYDALFKVPILAPPTFDGTRDVSDAFQRAIDGAIDDLVETLGIPCHHLNPDRRSGWVEEILAVLSLPLEPPQADLFATGSRA